MKKGCLLVFAVVMVLSIGGVSVTAFQLNRKYGVFEAEAVSHESFALAGTRLRFVVEPARLFPHIRSLLPTDRELPAWSPWDFEEALPKFLPREVALLSGADYAKAEIKVMLFVNERRGGPVLPQFANRSGVFDRFMLVEWAPEPLTFLRRGALTAEGAIPIPAGLEDILLEHWRHDTRGAPLRVRGGHLFEGVLDNRTGEIVTLMGALAGPLGANWEDLFQDPNIAALINILVDVNDIRVHGDLVDLDTLQFSIRIDAEGTASATLQFVPNALIIPGLKRVAQDRYGLTVEGETRWNAAEGALLGDFTVRGIEALLRQAAG